VENRTQEILLQKGVVLVFQDEPQQKVEKGGELQSKISLIKVGGKTPDFWKTSKGKERHCAPLGLKTP